jgi:hypothetical protein
MQYQSFTIVAGHHLAYKVKFDGSQINIKCLHNKEFFIWHGTVSDGLNKSSSSLMSINLTVKDTYEILLNYYKNGQSKQLVTVKFPETYQNQNFSLLIDIIIASPINSDIFDSKTIELSSIEQIETDRLHKKIHSLERNTELLFTSVRNMEEDMEQMRKIIVILLEGQRDKVKEEIDDLKLEKKLIN